MNRVRLPKDRKVKWARLSAGRSADLVPRRGETERLAKDLLDRTRSETTQAENKAAILLAGILAVTGGIVAAVGGNRISLHRPWYVILPFCAAAAVLMAAIACLAAALYPRGRVHSVHKPTMVGYFGDVLKLDSPSQLHGLLSESSNHVLDLWIDQIWQISAIVGRKYRFIRWSMRLLGVALALAVIVVVAATLQSQ